MCATHLIEQFYVVELLTIMVAAVFTISYNSKSKSGEKIIEQTPKIKAYPEEWDAKRKRRLWKNSRNKNLNHVSSEAMRKSKENLSEGGVSRTVGYISFFFSNRKIWEEVICTKMTTKKIPIYIFMTDKRIVRRA